MSEPSRSTDRIGLGIALMVLSVAVFTCMDAIIKHVAQAGYTTPQILFFRNLFAFIPLSILIHRQGGLSSLATKKPMAHLIRSLIGLTAMGSFFYGYRTLPLSEAISISFAAPLFMTALSVPMLDEQVGIRRWLAVIVGFVGVLIMVRPSAHMEPATLVMLFGTVFFSLAMIVVRRLSATETSSSIIFYFTLMGVVLSGALMPWFWITPNFTDLMLLISIGIIGGIAQILVTSSIKAAPIAILAPFEYTALLWAVGFDIVIWQIFPSFYTYLGAGILVSTGLYILHRETRRGTRARFPARFSRIRVSMGERKR
ncbi:MAG: DMT family transporter [Rhodospirillales bacterium]|jgi:drug/metabolite transporter (DMT)-like permease|nr:DMT family transporter [Rhodospirillales bacterium]MBT4039379.1 DMT family transporter [Rhodospirillales bacterium]MBT4627527.1 DMT family transporter [Rhodospirillales bacterium]MBT5352929.1 DMT family transporter [Rhodospirillales bacterium]MBT5520197.1 DMT family transporter [Rhodospirillales bacterium]